MPAGPNYFGRRPTLAAGTTPGRRRPLHGRSVCCSGDPGPAGVSPTYYFPRHGRASLDLGPGPTTFGHSALRPIQATTFLNEATHEPQPGPPIQRLSVHLTEPHTLPPAHPKHFPGAAHRASGRGGGGRGRIARKRAGLAQECDICDSAVRHRDGPRDCASVLRKPRLARLQPSGQSRK